MDLICEKSELYENELENLVMDKDYLKLSKNLDEGFLITPVIEIPEFTEITPSWNSKTSKDGFIELFIRIRIGENWTSFISYGKWSSDGYNVGITENQSSELVKVTEDRIIVNDDKFADAVQLKTILYGNEPKLKLIGFSTNSKEEEKLSGNYLKVIEGVTEISQLASGHKDCSSICSPTSLTMVLNYYKIPANLNDVAKGTFDTGSKRYGNWPQNVAYAGEQGLRAYTKSCSSINVIKNLIAKNIPVIASVCTKNDGDLEGAIFPFPYGHLMVVIGFEEKDGEEYIVVNDPAVNSDKEVRKSYKLNQWIKAWRHYIYVITK
jgi:hypothetical protein